MTRSTLCKISRTNNYLPLLLRESGQLVTDNRIRNTRLFEREGERGRGESNSHLHKMRILSDAVTTDSDRLVIDINSSRHDGSCR